MRHLQRRQVTFYQCCNIGVGDGDDNIYADEDGDDDSNGDDDSVSHFKSGGLLPSFKVFS